MKDPKKDPKPILVTGDALKELFKDLPPLQITITDPMDCVFLATTTFESILRQGNMPLEEGLIILTKDVRERGVDTAIDALFDAAKPIKEIPKYAKPLLKFMFTHSESKRDKKKGDDESK